MEILKCPECGHSWKRRKHCIDARVRCPNCLKIFLSSEEIEFRESVLKNLRDILSSVNRGLKAKSLIIMLRKEGLKVSGPYVSKLMEKESEFYHEGPGSGGVVKWKIHKQRSSSCQAIKSNV